MEDMRTQQVWIGNNLYTIEYPAGQELELLQKDAGPQQPEELPQAQEPLVNQIDDEWDERKGLFYTVIQMIFAYLILTQGASTLKSVMIAALLLLIGLTQLGYISWSNSFMSAVRFVQPGPIDEQQPIWKTLFLLSINFILSLFPGLNEIQ